MHHCSSTLKDNPKVLVLTCYVNGSSMLNTYKSFYISKVFAFKNIVATNTLLRHETPTQIASLPHLVPTILYNLIHLINEIDHIYISQNCQHGLGKKNHLIIVNMVQINLSTNKMVFLTPTLFGSFFTRFYS